MHIPSLSIYFICASTVNVVFNTDQLFLKPIFDIVKDKSTLSQNLIFEEPRILLKNLCLKISDQAELLMKKKLHITKLPLLFCETASRLIEILHSVTYPMVFRFLQQIGNDNIFYIVFVSFTI